MKFEEIREIVDSINQDIIDSFPPEKNGGNDDLGLYPRLIIKYVDYLGFIVSFQDLVIWDEDNDERKFIEEINDYEPLEPFLIKRCKEIIQTYSQIKL